MFQAQKRKAKVLTDATDWKFLQNNATSTSVTTDSLIPKYICILQYSLCLKKEVTLLGTDVKLLISNK